MPKLGTQKFKKGWIYEWERPSKYSTTEIFNHKDKQYDYNPHDYLVCPTHQGSTFC